MNETFAPDGIDGHPCVRVEAYMAATDRARAAEAEVERLSDIAMRNAGLLIEADERTHAAEAEVATLRATLQRIEDLADRWDERVRPGMVGIAKGIRAALRNEP